MRKKSMSFVMLFTWLLLTCTSLFAQKARKPAELVKDAIQKNVAFAKLEVQHSQTAKTMYSARLASQVKEYALFQFNRAADLSAQTGGAIELTLPATSGAITLQLIPVNIYADGFSVKTSSGEKAVSTGWFYQGAIKGNENSVAAISIFEDEIAGFISSTQGNFVIGKLRNADKQAPANIVYRDNALTVNPTLNCGTPDIALPTPPPSLTELTARCVRIYYESELDFYTAFGNNATSVTNYVTNLFNQNKTLYNNDGISVSLSEIFVWTTTDPYNGANSGLLLGEFQATRTSFNGDVGQLITTRAIGGGQAAVIYGLCAASVANRLCVSGDMTTAFPNVPTYSWEVMVTTHEMGHLMGSRHTHACVWNGNNTAIDGCSGFVEGSCPLPGIPSAGGTIMSYCHLQSVGINFNNGFGPQPAAQIRNSIEASACLAGCSAATCCGPLTGLAATSITNTSATLSWNSLSGATSYVVEYRLAGAATWTALATTVGTSVSLTGLTQNTQYEWRVKANCNEAASYFAVSSFTTAAPCTTPTGLAASNITSSGATLGWTAASSAVSYTVEYRVSGAATWIVAGTVTTNSISLTGLLGSTTYEWQVRTNCSASSSGYAASTFTTLIPAACGIPIGLWADTYPCEMYADLYWDALPGAVSYTVERKTSLQTTYTVIATGVTTNYLFNVFSNGTYNWRVMANCAGGSGNYSAVATYFCRYNSKICDGNLRPNTQMVELKLNPQPAEGRVSVSFHWASLSQGLLTIRNQFGISLLQKSVQLKSGLNNIPLDISGIKPGVYYVYLNANGQIVSQKLVVGNQ
jgi:hypothetical protein